MNIEIKNFGPIEYLKIDLEKDLHLIYGKNAIGKSYAIYCIYCLLKNIRNTRNREMSPVSTRRFGEAHFLSQEEPNLSSLFRGSNTRDQKYKKAEQKDITKLYTEIIERDFRILFLKEFENSLLNTFSDLKNLRNRYNDKNFEVIINLPNSNICKRLTIFLSEDENLDIKFEFEKRVEFLEKNTKTTRYSIYVNGEKLFGVSTQQEFLQEFRSYLLLEIIHIYDDLNANMREIYFLPASRSGLYQALNSFAPIIAELTQSRFFIASKNIELPSLSEPLSDYFIDLSTVDKTYINTEFSDLVQQVERNILKGEVDYDEKTKKITYKPNGLNIELNLSEASSMVAELTPLVLYLKHIINHKFNPDKGDPFFAFVHSTPNKGSDLLFIEEPEAHLHPDVQVELMRIFAELTKHRLKMFITSHSNYMFHKFNNIILSKGIDAQKISVYHLVQAKNGSTQDIQMIASHEGIDDNNFQETSEHLYEERMRILEEVEA